jgi:UDP-2,4-diacetamido-2,4,6-trideoxy-beta-L-altropyranose hydrolase/UDP-4-amino-4,6-dideoxy-N-acetyl-beta-L-altrosamine N-acetyltransferase
MLVIDHYGIGYKEEKYIKQKTGVKILSFDDTYEKHHCDILLNHNISADKKRYKDLVPKHCKIKCGSKYTLLRDEFYKEKNKKYKKNKKFTFFVAMGGADTANLNTEILKVLERFENIKVYLVTTNANKRLEELKKYSKGKEWIKLYINSNKVAKLMRKSDFAIITPSVTLNEVVFMGLAFIAIKTADNQKDIYRYLKKHGYLVLKKFSYKKLQRKVKDIFKPKLVNFVDLSLKEKKMVLKWRNDLSLRKWMYSQEIISLENHLEYIRKLLYKKDKIYFLLKYRNEPIGVTDFTDIDYINGKSHFGLYAKPGSKGFGKILLSCVIDYAFNNLKINTLVAEVFKDNFIAINLYRKFNFKEKTTNKNIIVMELKNEDRQF